MEENRTAPTSAADHFSPAYRAVTAAVWPIVRWWGRLEVVGAQCLPTRGATIVLANHDSAWDPVVIAAAARRRRQIHALAKASLWKHPLLGRVLDGMGQIPVDRGRADTAAMDVAAQCLAAGGCVGIFPEGTVSRGRHLRARSGAGRLAQAAPQARIVCAAVSGTVDIARFPRRPRLRVTFFEPARSPAAEESAQELSARLTAEIRALVPAVESGRGSRAAESPRAAARPGQRG
jgi:1-acyl-sn-glycerol-3-phosphate acyltransferase